MVEVTEEEVQNSVKLIPSLSAVVSTNGQCQSVPCERPQQSGNIRRWISYVSFYNVPGAWNYKVLLDYSSILRCSAVNFCPSLAHNCSEKEK